MNSSRLVGRSAASLERSSASASASTTRPSKSTASQPPSCSSATRPAHRLQRCLESLRHLGLRNRGRCDSFYRTSGGLGVPSESDKGVFDLATRVTWGCGNSVDLGQREFAAKFEQQPGGDLGSNAGYLLECLDIPRRHRLR